MTTAPVIPPRLAKRITSYLRTLSQRWDADLESVRVSLNPRLTRTVARFRPPVRTIEISGTVLAMPAVRQRDVVCHEAAHAVVWARHGRRAKPHGAEWAALVRAAGHEPMASLIRCGATLAPRRATSRFRHTCQVCHFSSVASRRMPRWRCPECTAIGLPGTLTLERIR
jgi:SprT protein